MTRLSVGDTWRNTRSAADPCAVVLSTDEEGLSYKYPGRATVVHIRWDTWDALYAQGKVTIVARVQVRPLYCTWCGKRHEDLDVWASRPHHTHSCSWCGGHWRLDGYVFGEACGLEQSK